MFRKTPHEEAKFTGNVCPVCFYPGLRHPYEDCSYNICESCGVEYGYDDFVPTGGDIAARHTELRAEWKASGCPWWTSRIERPVFWSVKKAQSADAVARGVDDQHEPTPRA